MKLEPVGGADGGGALPDLLLDYQFGGVNPNEKQTPPVLLRRTVSELVAEQANVTREEARQHIDACDGDADAALRLILSRLQDPRRASLPSEERKGGSVLPDAPAGPTSSRKGGVGSLNKWVAPTHSKIRREGGEGINEDDSSVSSLGEGAEPAGPRTTHAKLQPVVNTGRLLRSETFAGTFAGPNPSGLLSSPSSIGLLVSSNSTTNTSSIKFGSPRLGSKEVTRAKGRGHDRRVSVKCTPVSLIN